MHLGRTPSFEPFKDVFVGVPPFVDPENVFLKLRAHHVYSYERYSIYYIAWTPLGQRSNL
jgi:hypothetical protein